MNAGRSGMTGDCHVPICEGLGVKFPRATRPDQDPTVQLLREMHFKTKGLKFGADGKRLRRVLVVIKQE
jgi:hypothetical protein